MPHVVHTVNLCLPVRLLRSGIGRDERLVRRRFQLLVVLRQRLRLRLLQQGRHADSWRGADAEVIPVENQRLTCQFVRHRMPGRR